MAEHLRAFAPLREPESGLPLHLQQAIFDTEAASITVRKLRREPPRVNFTLIAAGPAIALAVLLFAHWVRG